MRKTIQITEQDNVVVALHPIEKGEAITVGDETVIAAEDIPQGHKMSIRPIEEGSNVIKYGFPIGHATASVPAGKRSTHFATSALTRFAVATELASGDL